MKDASDSDCFFVKTLYAGNVWSFSLVMTEIFNKNSVCSTSEKFSYILLPGWTRNNNTQLFRLVSKKTLITLVGFAIISRTGKN